MYLLFKSIRDPNNHNHYLMKTIPLLLLIFISAHSIHADHQFQRTFLSQERGAACLDGSAPAIFIHEGSVKDKFLIFLQGGGFCHDPHSCYLRAKYELGLGTSNHTREHKEIKEGICSPQRDKNPVFWNWMKVYVNYCDGTLYFGDREEPQKTTKIPLYFRGSRNILQLFRLMEEKYDFYNQNTIVLSGVSAGAVGTYYWVDYLKDHTKSSKVYAIPDSGIFLPKFVDLKGKTPLETHFSTMLQMVGVSKNKENIPPPVQKCLDQKGQGNIDCIGSAQFTNYIQSPMFIVQSLYDAFSIEFIVGTQCSCDFSIFRCFLHLLFEIPQTLKRCDQNQRQYIHSLSDRIRQTINGIIVKKKNVGVWAVSCAQHGFLSSHSYKSNHYRVPGQSGTQIYQGIQKFLNDVENAPRYIDKVKWPNNKGCHTWTIIQAAQDIIDEL